MSKYLKKALNFLLPGLFTSLILLAPFIYKEVELSRLPVIDQVSEIISSDPVYYQGSQEAEAKCGIDEFTWLACGIYFESRSEPAAGQYNVAQVILNRANDPNRWPDTIEAVVREGEQKRNRCQFSFMCDGQEENIFEELSWMQALEIATMAMEDYYESGPITCAHSYHANYVTSEKALQWFATLEAYETIGKHTFFCDRQS